MKIVMLALIAVASLTAQSHEQPGPTADGGFLLNSGWRIKPAGTQIPVDTFPMSAKVTPDGKSLLVLNGGIHPPSISVIDLATAKETARVPVPDAWLGLTTNRAGDRVYVGGGSKGAVYEFTFAAGVLKPSRAFAVTAEKNRKAELFIGDVQLAPDGHLLYAADLYGDSVVVINPQSGLILSRIKTGRRPYRILFHPSGNSFYVSSWMDGSVGQYDPNSGERIANIRVGPHATDMVWSAGPVDEQPAIAARLFVSASNTNTVYVLAATEAGALSRLETINLALSSRQPLGLTPSGLGLSADSHSLYVACSGFNAAVVVDISGPRGRVKGLVPAGSYPTAVFGLPDGRMGILNGRGTGRPAVGTVQIADIFDDRQLASFTREVARNTPYRDERLDDAGTPAGNPVRADGPIKHVIYIVRGAEGHSPALPNASRLAAGFVQFDNFYVNSETAADGQNWATAAIAPDYTERLSPNSSAGRRKTFDFEGEEPLNSPPAGFLWTAASQAGIAMRNYGFFVDNRKTPEADGTQITGIRDPILAPVTDPNYRGFDPAYPNKDRAKEFIGELHDDFEKQNNMPALLLISLAGDATADNDRALGMIVEAISNSRFWSDTAIFVSDTFAQDASDRASALVISPWAKHGATATTMYNQMSVLRTMELILGLHPLTIFDAAATPMFGAFTGTPDNQPFTLQKQ